MTPTVWEVLARRAADRDVRLQLARVYAEGLAAHLGVRAVAVIGSVARGDFNAWSDLDVLVVADHLPDDPITRLQAVGSPAPGGIEVIPWTPQDWAFQLQRRNPVAVEAAEQGVWLIGSQESAA